MILKQLLLATGPIEQPSRYKPDYKQGQRRNAKGKFIKKSHTVRGYKLYPQILSCCQTLQSEGRFILYGQNTLMAIIRFISVEVEDGPVVECMPFWNCTNDRFVGVKNHLFGKFFRQFDHFRLGVRQAGMFRPAKFVGKGMQLLAPLVKEKKVQLFLKLSDSDEHAVLPTFLKTLQFLRCTTFKLLVSSTVSEPLYADIQRRVEHIVVSRTEVKDLTGAHDFYQFFIAGWTPSHLLFSELARFSKAAYTFDVDTFVEIKGKLHDLRIAAVINDHLEKDADTERKHENAIEAVRAQQEFFKQSGRIIEQ